MKKVLRLLLMVLFLTSLMLSIVSAQGFPGLPGGGMEIPYDLPQLPRNTPIDFQPGLPGDGLIPDDPFPLDPHFPAFPTATPKNKLDPPGKKYPLDPNKKFSPRTTATPKPEPSTTTEPPGKSEPPQVPSGVSASPGTPKTKVPKVGEFVTSEGPLFIMFRDNLTKGYEMFTPMDLSMDGEYVFPLVSNAMHTVGNVTVTVKKGFVTVHPQMFSGVKMRNGILTFFADIQSVKTIKPKKLYKVDMPFDVPIDVIGRLGGDVKVLMYINCPVNYKGNSPYIQSFSMADPYYLERMYALIDLMD